LPRTRFPRTEALAEEQPSSMMARIRLALPVIEAGLNAGHTLRTMHQCLNQDGIPISYKNLSLCRRRILRAKSRSFIST